MPGTFTHALSSVEHRLDLLKLKFKARFDRFDPIRILPYRGFSNGERLWLRGRVLEDRGVTHLDEGSSALDNLMDMWRRYETDEIPRAVLEVGVGAQRERVVTDDEGFFEVDVVLTDPQALLRPWSEVQIRLLESFASDSHDTVVGGEVLVPTANAEFGVISDLDDTVVKTGATDLLKHFSTVLLNNAHTREPFEGVADLYQALKLGPDGRGVNPLFYVSSSPWNLYSLFEDFMDVHGIPPGPIFLKDFGLDRDKFIKSGHDEYKVERAGRILDTFPDLRFILIGDSGQRDAFVYREVVRQHPGRVLAVYLRDLTPETDADNYREIQAELADRGVPMVLVRDSHEAAEHAAAQGWIRAD